MSLEQLRIKRRENNHDTETNEAKNNFKKQQHLHSFQPHL